MGRLLETSDLSKSFGGIKAVQNFLIHIDEGEVIGLIGPNGAGKTTAFNLLTGVYTPTTGKILFDGKDITGRKPYQITALGIARTFQNIRLFGELSVLENVKIAFTLHASYSFPEAILRLGRYGREEQIIDDRARELLAAFKLDSWPTSRRKTCLTASSAAWRSPVRSPPVRSSCFWTNRPPA